MHVDLGHKDLDSEDLVRDLEDLGCDALIKGMHATTINMQHDILSIGIKLGIVGQRTARAKRTKSHSTGSNTHTHTNGLNAKTKANTV